mmetsp:Transcript_52508/g.111558  ORF Transcript_52508/g.111558 Transcript_52508/m.111558 type:complete len:90 (-) Transcript_52508:24-293(-)
MDAVAGDNLSKEGELTDTAVLDLDISETVEALLVGIIKQAERVEEAQRRLDAKLVLKGIEGGDSLTGLGRGEGSGTSHKCGESGKFHHG